MGASSNICGFMPVLTTLVPRSLRLDSMSRRKTSRRSRRSPRSDWLPLLNPIQRTKSNRFWMDFSKSFKQSWRGKTRLKIRTLVPWDEVGPEGTREIDQFRPLQVILQLPVHPPIIIGGSSFGIMHLGVLTSSIHGQGAITTIGLRETGAVGLRTSGTIGTAVRTAHPDR